MHKFATCFSVIFLLLTLTMLSGIIYFNMPLLLSGNKMVWFACLNSILLVFVGVFFTMFKERIVLYLQNYRREKQI